MHSLPNTHTRTDTERHKHQTHSCNGSNEDSTSIGFVFHFKQPPRNARIRLNVIGHFYLFTRHVYLFHSTLFSFQLFVCCLAQEKEEENNMNNNNNAIEISFNEMIIKKKNLPSNWLRMGESFTIFIMDEKSVVIDNSVLGTNHFAHNTICRGKIANFWRSKKKKCVSIQLGYWKWINKREKKWFTN